jgi:hypothetical protein
MLPAMKKLWLKILLVLVALVIIAGILGFVFLDSIVKRSVETVGPAIAKVEVKLAGAHISPFSGSGKLKGLVVGNPPDYKTSEAIKVGEVGVSVVPSSMMGDKVIVRSVKVVGPEITFEGSLSGNNLSKILENVQGTEAKTQPQTKEETKAKTRKLQVDDFLISGGKVHMSATLLGGKSATVPLPEIHLTKLGQGPEGITPAELVSKVLKEVTDATVKAVGAAIGNVGKEMTENVKNLGTGTVEQVGKNVKGIGDLFKKKPAATNESK